MADFEALTFGLGVIPSGEGKEGKCWVLTRGGWEKWMWLLRVMMLFSSLKLTETYCTLSGGDFRLLTAIVAKLQLTIR